MTEDSTIYRVFHKKAALRNQLLKLTTDILKTKLKWGINFKLSAVLELL